MPQYITKQGLEKLKKELDLLETVERKKVAEKISRAASQGDISDSADYVEAKEAQAFLEGKIDKLRKTVLEAQIIEKKESNGIISPGSIVLIEINGQKEKFEIVGSTEADPINGKISEKSPLGAAFLGHKKGDEIKVETPGGEVSYRIVEIQ